MLLYSVYTAITLDLGSMSITLYIMYRTNVDVLLLDWPGPDCEHH